VNDVDVDVDDADDNRESKVVVTDMYLWMHDT